MARKSLFGSIRQAFGGHGAQSQQVAGAADRRIGMRVVTNDGTGVGSVVALWRGADAADGAPHDDTLGIQLQDQGPEGQVYIPTHAIAGESDRTLRLTVDMTQVKARGWYYRPDWFPKGDPQP